MFILAKFWRRCLYVLSILLISTNNAQATFYQADTMAENCHEYIEFISLGKAVNQFEAGICSGFIASTIELMDLSERLCKRNELNLDDVVKQFVERVTTNEAAKNNSATFVLVDVLQKNYACEQSN